MILGLAQSASGGGVDALLGVGEEVVDGYARNVVGAVAEQCVEGSVGLEEVHGCGVEEENGVGGLLHDGPVALFAFAQHMRGWPRR